MKQVPSYASAKKAQLIQNMSTQSIDTHPEIEKLQISLIRNASVSKRISKVRSLSQSVIRLSKRAILRANPNFSQMDADIAFIEYHYGRELSVSVKKYLNKKKS
jgi:hypothetical protein